MLGRLLDYFVRKKLGIDYINNRLITFGLVFTVYGVYYYITKISIANGKERAYLQYMKYREGRNIFVPTREWQVIGENDILPPNLHYRINMTTGLREAKLLDDSC